MKNITTDESEGTMFMFRQGIILTIIFIVLTSFVGSTVSVLSGLPINYCVVSAQLLATVGLIISNLVWERW